MFLIFILTTITFSTLCFADCPQNKTYGTFCNNNCTNCSTGCDVSGSCYDGACLLKFYGTGCRENNIRIAKAPTLASNNCVIHVTTVPYNLTNVGVITYYVVYGPATANPSMDYSLWSSVVPMTNYQADVTISGGSYMFGIYFDFIDNRYITKIESLVSLVNNATCNMNMSSTASLISILSTASTTSTANTATTTSSSTTKAPVTESSTILSSSVSTTLSTSMITALSTSEVYNTVYTTGVTTSVANNYSVQDLYYSKKTATFISLIWNPPVNSSGLKYYKLVVQLNGNVVQTLNSSGQSQDIYSLLPGNKYTINVSAIFKTYTLNNSYIIICTEPASDISVDQIQVSSVDRKSMNVVFPVDRTNYSCSTNIYRIGAVVMSLTSRKKRAASSTSAIPSEAVIYYNGTQFPSSLTLSKLNSATNYTLYAEIYTSVNGSVTYYFSTTFQQTNGPSDGAIVGIVIGILLFILLIIILLILLCLYRKRKEKLTNQFYGNYESPLKDIVTDGKPSSSAYWSGISDKMEPRYLILNPKEWTDDLANMNTLSFTNQNYCPDGLRFIDEYNSLPEDSPYSHIASETNYLKNKKQDIFPYDHNRVKLRRKLVNNQTDYINASFIDGYLRKKAYIASQSPFDEETTNDFWHMIYEQNIGQVIMLTETAHGNVTKSTAYWPQMDSRSKEVMFGTISVKIINEINFAFYDIREFEVKDSSYMVEPQLVTQYHFHGWPHNDTPDNSIAFLDFYQAIKVYADISNGPLLVHCGTGISQTAVFIAFDILNQQVIHENCVNVFRTVAQLRRSRYKMVHNSKHYMFIYDLLFESILCGQFIVNTNVRKLYKLLQKKNPQSGIEYLHEQFYLLQTYHKVTTTNKRSTKEISFMDSIEYSQNLSSIPSPMMNVNKVEEFWNTVYDNNIHVIIDLRTTEDNPYYIIDNLKAFEVAIEEISTVNKCFRRFQLTVYNNREGKKIHVSLYQLGTPWVINDDINGEPDDNEGTMWVEMIFHLLMNHSGHNILAHCVNGWSKSGLFLTSFNVAVKLYKSKYVMIYNVVKSMKFYRFEFVTSFAQFDFIFTFLKRWVDMKMSDASFNKDYLPGFLQSGDKFSESLFTHEQMPILRPDEKQRFAPSLRSFGSHEYPGSEAEDDVLIVHYNIGTSSELAV